jgi:hypothetical protein
LSEFKKKANIEWSKFINLSEEEQKIELPRLWKLANELWEEEKKRIAKIKS